MIDRLGELHDAAAAVSTQAEQASSSRRKQPFGFLRRAAPSPSTPLLDTRSGVSLQPPPTNPLQQFLGKLEAIRRGPLQELEARSKEVSVLHSHALVATSAAAEKEALANVERCADEASRAAQQTCDELQKLVAEVEDNRNETEARLRKQSFTGVSVLFQNALSTYYHVQQEFRKEMETKVSRQLRVAFPEADDLAVAAVAAEQRSAGSAIQQRASGTSLSLQELQFQAERCDELEKLAKAARELRQRFVDVEVRVLTQGEVISDIGHHVDATRIRTEAVREQLGQANQQMAQIRCRWRWLIIVVILACVLVLLITLLRKGRS